jgi:hypothetical protein
MNHGQAIAVQRFFGAGSLELGVLLVLGVWSLEFPWCLVFEAWCFDISREMGFKSALSAERWMLGVGCWVFFTT